MGGRTHIVTITTITLIVITALLLLSSTLIQNKALAQTITVNNITGSSKNATGTIIIKDNSQITNSTILLEKILSQLPNNNSKKEQELKSIQLSQTHWWQYNTGSKLAP